MHAFSVHWSLAEAREREETLPTTLSEKEKSAVTIWLKLENLYMTKSLANRLFLKYKLYIFKMMPRKTLEDYIDDFNKIILDLENIEIKMDEKDQALLLLRSLPS